MVSYAVYKSDKKIKLKKRLALGDGYSFKSKINITMYESDLIKDILVKKINTSLKNIMLSLINIEDSSDDDDERDARVSELKIRIETLRTLLLEKYFPFIGKTRVNAYLSRLEEIEGKIPERENRKSRRR